VSGRVRLIYLLLVLLMVAGCRPGDSTVDPGDTSFAPPEDPADVEVDYVNAVLGALGEAEVRAYRAAADRGAVDERLRADLAVVLGEPAAEERIVNLLQNGGVSLLAGEPLGRPYTASRVLESTGECIAVYGEFAQTGLVEEGNAPQPAKFLLERREGEGGGNPTPWHLTALRRGLDAEQPLRCDQ